MKRSEMIEKVIKLLDEYDNTNSNNIRKACSILNLIEFEGMQPPTITVLKDSYNRQEGCMGFEVNEWENE